MPTGFFFHSSNAPDAKVILNRNTPFEFDITSDVISFNTSNDISNIFGTFTVVIDNTNDKHIDRFGVADISIMSSIEIFVLSNVAKSNSAPESLQPIQVLTKEGQSISSIIDDIYGLTNYPTKATSAIQTYKSQYLSEITKLNPNKTIRFVGGKKNVISNSLDIRTICDYELEGGQNLTFPPPITAYKRIFLGVVETVQESFSAGSPMTISITGESFGYWLKVFNVNIAPGQTESGVTGVSTAESKDLQNYANKYAERKALDIFRDLLKASTNDTLTVANFSFNTTTTTYENMQATDNLNTGNTLTTALSGDKFTDPVTGNSLTLNQAFTNAYHGKGIPIPKTFAETLGSLDDLENSVSAGTYLDGTDIQSLKISEDTDKVIEKECIDYQNLSKNYDTELKAFKNLSDRETANISKQEQIKDKANTTPQQKIAAQVSIDASTKKIDDRRKSITDRAEKLRSNPIVRQQLQTIEAQRQKIRDKINGTQTTGTQVLEQLGVIQVWKEIFSQMTLEVANASYLQQVTPLKTILKAPGLLDGDYQPKSQLTKQIADAINFEFYMDTNGHFVLKPPLYNIGIPNDDPTYIIAQEDILSMNVNNTVDGMISRIGITGDILQPNTLQREMLYNVHVDLNLVKKYGVHNMEILNLLSLRTIQDAKDYGESYMAKNNQELRTASITVLGRPDIRLGVACYLKPRDTVYYIKSISHDFQVGGQYTTTISLSGARRIIVGYKVNSPIHVATQQIIDGITIRSSKNASKDGVEAPTVTHYVLANSLSQIAQLANSRNVDSKGVPIAPKQFAPVRNSYIIVSHPDIGYVGLIVDQDSTVYNDINYNTFKYIYRASRGPITNALKATKENITANWGKDIGPFERILNFLVKYIKKNNVGGGGAFTEEQLKQLKENDTTAENPFNKIAQGFNQAVLNDYISSFLNEIEIQTIQPKKDNNVNQLEILAGTNNIFNTMLLEVNSLGSYRAYTDENGREYPATLNFGQGLKIENSLLSINTTSAAKVATNPEAKINFEVEEIIKEAKRFGARNSSQPSPKANI